MIGFSIDQMTIKCSQGKLEYFSYCLSIDSEKNSEILIGLFFTDYSCQSAARYDLNDSIIVQCFYPI